MNDGFSIHSVDLDTLDSMTKYPSIPTYHDLDPSNGTLRETGLREKFSGAVVITEKVDGTNGRVIFLPDGSYVIGSREELLYASGDVVHNPKQGIVDALRPVAERAKRPLVSSTHISVAFLEVYGGQKITAGSKHYTGTGQVGVRLFDVLTVPAGTWPEVLSWPVERIAFWRERGGQQFGWEGDLHDAAAALDVPLVPRLGTVNADELPVSVDDAHQWLKGLLPTTTVALDDAAKGEAEGVVLRSLDRAAIAKVRFQNYRRTAQVRAGAR